MTTIVTEEPDSWTTPAGWGIYADLTPPELLTARLLHRVRRMLLLVLTGAVVVVLLVFGYSVVLDRRAAADLADQDAQTTRLVAAQSRYSQVVAVQGAAAAVRNRLSQLMTSDVEYSALLTSLRAAQPDTLSVNQLSITVSAAGAAAAAVGTDPLATSGTVPVGGITIGGTSRSLTDLGTFVSRLRSVHGVVDVLPATLTTSGGAFTYTISMSIDSAALSHKYVPVSAAGTP